MAENEKTGRFAPFFIDGHHVVWDRERDSVMCGSPRIDREDTHIDGHLVVSEAARRANAYAEEGT